MPTTKLKVTKYPSCITMPDDLVNKLVDAAADCVRGLRERRYINDADGDIEGACLAILIVAASNKIAIPKDIEPRLVEFATDKEWRDAKLGCVADGVERALDTTGEGVAP